MKERGLIPDLGVIQAHLLRPSEKQSSLSSVIFLLSVLEEFDPLRLFPLEADAILNGDDSHEDDASDEYDAFMETPFLLRIEGLRGDELFFAGDAVKVRSFDLSVFFTGFDNGFCCSLLPAGTRTDRNSRSEADIVLKVSDFSITTEKDCDFPKALKPNSKRYAPIPRNPSCIYNTLF